MTTQYRLKKIMLANNLNLKEFSEKIEIPYRTLQNYLLGKRTIRMDALANICIHMGINLNWLVSGQGEMYERKDTEKVETLGGTIEWLHEWWDGADEKHRHWLEVQMRRCFPEYARWADKEE